MNPEQQIQTECFGQILQNPPQNRGRKMDGGNDPNPEYHHGNYDFCSQVLFC